MVLTFLNVITEIFDAVCGQHALSVFLNVVVSHIVPLHKLCTIYCVEKCMHTHSES